MDVRLPKEIWMNIFSFMRARDLLRTMTVSKQWKSIAEETSEPFREVTLGAHCRWMRYSYDPDVPKLRAYKHEDLDHWDEEFADISRHTMVKLSESYVYTKHLRVMRIGCNVPIPKRIEKQVEELHISAYGETNWDRIHKLAPRITSLTLHHASRDDLESLGSCQFGHKSWVRLIDNHPMLGWIRDELSSIKAIYVDLPTRRIVTNDAYACNDLIFMDWNSWRTDWIEKCKDGPQSHLRVNIQGDELDELFRRADDIACALPNLECLELGLDLLDYDTPTDVERKFHTIKQLTLDFSEDNVSGAEDAIDVTNYILKHFTSTLESLCIIAEAPWILHPEDPRLNRFLTTVSVPHLYLAVTRLCFGSQYSKTRKRYKKCVRKSKSNIYVYFGERWETLIRKREEDDTSFDPHTLPRKRRKVLK